MISLDFNDRKRKNFKMHLSEYVFIVIACALTLLIQC